MLIIEAVNMFEMRPFARAGICRRPWDVDTASLNPARLGATRCYKPEIRADGVPVCLGCWVTIRLIVSRNEWERT